MPNNFTRTGPSNKALSSGHPGNILFGRGYSFSFGKPGDMGKKVTDLRITFDINKTITSDLNECKISIYNLSPDSMGRLIPLENVCTLSVGYEDKLKTLFTGYISEVKHDFTAVDIETELIIFDGLKQVKEGKTASSFDNTYSYEKVIDKAVGDIKKAAPTLAKVTDKAKTLLKSKIKNNLAYVGSTKNLLDTVTHSAGCQWSILNNEILISARDEYVRSTAYALHLSPDNGLIGSPVRISNVNMGDDDKLRTGWKFNSLLIPTMWPGDPIYLTSRDIGEKKLFKIINLRYSGDTHGDDWSCEGECIAL